MNLSLRSDQKELLDQEDVPFDDIERNMYELNIINSLLGGHAITLTGFRQLLRKKEQQAQQGKQGRKLSEKGDPSPLLVAEIGCGGGDNLLAIRRYCQRIGQKVQFIGVDLNPHCIAVAASKFPETEARWITSDYRKVSFLDIGYRRPDIVFSSLFCHHFGDRELVKMLRWMQAESGTGFFINDLHRHALAYHGIRLLVSLCSSSRLVKNDAPLSVLRGFRRAEWEHLIQEAEIKNYSLEWKWAFRWLIVA